MDKRVPSRAHRSRRQAIATVGLATVLGCSGDDAAVTAEVDDVATGTSGGAMVTGDGDGGGGESDGGSESGSGGEQPTVLGEQFDMTPVQIPHPAGGTTLGGFAVLDNQYGHRHVGDEYWVTTDMTGDGLPDLVLTTVIRDIVDSDPEAIFDEPYGYPAQPHWRVFEGDGAGFASAPITWAVPAGGQTNRGFNRWTNQAGNERDRNNRNQPNLPGDAAWIVRDMNGDARPDLVVTGVANEHVGFGFVFRAPGFGIEPHWLVYENDGAGFADAPTMWPIPALPGDRFGGVANAESIALTEHNTHQWALRDIDGDARPDLIVQAEIDEPFPGMFRNRPPGHPAEPHWEVYLNDGGGFASVPTRWGLPKQRGAGERGLNRVIGIGLQEGHHTWDMIDVDGDRRPELVVTAVRMGPSSKTHAFPAEPHWEVYPNTGSGFGSVQRWTLPRGGTGDGGFIRLTGIGRAVAGDSAWTTTDIDGDGVIDLVLTGEYVNAVPGGIYQLGRLANDPHWLVYRGGSSGFSQQADRWSTPPGGLRGNGFNTSTGYGGAVGDEAWTLMDFDGDGRVDLLHHANIVEDPEFPGANLTIPQAPGHPSGRWMLYRNVPHSAG